MVKGAPRNSTRKSREVLYDKKISRSLCPLTQESAAASKNAYKIFQKNPGHPGLRFKRIHSQEPIFAVRIGRDYRALGVRHEDEIVWFWIGSHSDYDRLLP